MHPWHADHAEKEKAKWFYYGERRSELKQTSAMQKNWPFTDSMQLKLGSITMIRPFGVKSNGTKSNNFPRSHYHSSVWVESTKALLYIDSECRLSDVKVGVTLGLFPTTNVGTICRNSNDLFRIVDHKHMFTSSTKKLVQRTVIIPFPISLIS